jgi:hypothetical protein
LLEDDYDVDWEVDWDEPDGGTHPHRAPLRGGFVRRRPGQSVAAPNLCVSPVVRSHLRPAPKAPTKTGRPQATRV